MIDARKPRQFTRSIKDWVQVFSTDHCRKQLEPDYFLKARDLRLGVPQGLAQLGKVGALLGLAADSLVSSLIRLSPWELI